MAHPMSDLIGLRIEVVLAAFAALSRMTTLYPTREDDHCHAAIAIAYIIYPAALLARCNSYYHKASRSLAYSVFMLSKRNEPTLLPMSSFRTIFALSHLIFSC